MNDAAADPLAEIEAARARVEAQVREAEQRRVSVGSLADEMQALTVIAQSPRGEVLVAAQPNGRVLSVELTNDAERLSAAALGQLISTTIAAAQHQAAQAAVTRAEQQLGEQSVFVSQLRSEAFETFPAPAAGDSIGYR